MRQPERTDRFLVTARQWIVVYLFAISKVSHKDLITCYAVGRADVVPAQRIILTRNSWSHGMPPTSAKLMPSSEYPLETQLTLHTWVITTLFSWDHLEMTTREQK